MELILTNYQPIEQKSVINKDFGNKLCEMLFVEIAEREAKYVERRGFGVAINSRSGIGIGLSGANEVLRCKITSQLVAIDIQDQPKNSPSKIQALNITGCVIL